MQAVLIDLDETLYALGDALIQTVDRRITEFIVRHTGMPWERADWMRRDLWIRYGTTARGLNRLYDIDQREVYRFAVDSVDPSAHVSPDPLISEALSRIGAPCYVFTNASEEYTRRVLDVLGVAESFAGVFSIEFSFYNPKPSPIYYERIVAALGVPSGEIAFIDDNPGNFAPALDMGMHCIQVGGRGCPPDGVVCVERFQDVPAVLSSSSS